MSQSQRSESVLLARREFKHLASVYVLSTIHLSFELFKPKAGGGLVSNVWYGFVVFQMFRAACFTGKLTSFDCESRCENWFEEKLYMWRHL